MKDNLNTIYVSERLRQRPDKLSQSALTTVVAPAGYGKSFALRYFWDQVGTDDSVFRQCMCDPLEGFSQELSTAIRTMEGPRRTMPPGRSLCGT